MSHPAYTSLKVMSAAVTGSPAYRSVMHPIEFETSFGMVAAGEQALIEAIREMLASEVLSSGDDVADLVNP